MAKMARPTSQSHRGEFTMTDRLPAGLLALAFSLIIALPAHAQDPPTAQEKKGSPVVDDINGPPPPPPPIAPPAPSTPEKKALLKELLGLMKASDNSEAIANQFMDQLQPAVASGISNYMRGWIQAQKWPPAEQKRMEALGDETVQRILTRTRAEIPKRVNFAELVEKVAVEVYNKHFTEVEVKDLIAFCKTSAAQKFTGILPQIVAEIMPGIEKPLDTEPAQLITELIEKAALKAYGKYFTEAEVKELIAFCKTSTAQKFARIQPQIIAELASGTRNAMVPEVTPLISEIVDTETMKLTQKRN
jgi:hypothetical protein